MHDLLKARPRSMAIRLLHGESSTSTAKRPAQIREECVRIGVSSMYVRMHNELATKLGSQINTIVCLQFSSAKQTRIDDFFNCSCTISI